MANAVSDNHSIIKTRELDRRAQETKTIEIYVKSSVSAKGRIGGKIATRKNVTQYFTRLIIIDENHLLSPLTSRCTILCHARAFTAILSKRGCVRISVFGTIIVIRLIPRKIIRWRVKLVRVKGRAHFISSFVSSF